jgi:MFS transporter, DHA1 family, tetracycline resistance protein
MPTVEAFKQAPATGRGNRAPRLILFLTVFVDLLGFGIVIPFLPMFAARMGVGAGAVGPILAVYSLMQLLCAPLLGRISDRVGRRPIIMLGLLGSSLSYLIYGFADSFALLLFSRAVHGACAATVSTAQAYVADTTDESGRAQGMGMIGAAFGLGFVLGPALGGVLGHHSLRTPVFFASALTFANLLFAARYLPESHEASSAARLTLARALEPLLRLPRDLAGHRLARLFALAFLLTFVLGALEATFSLMVPRVYGYGPYGVGLLLGYTGLVQAIAQGYLLGKMVRQFGELRILRLGAIALALGLAPLGSLGSHTALLVMLALIAIGYGLASPAVASLISKRSERQVQGEVLGINQSALSLARIFGPIIGAGAYAILGAPAPYIGGALVTVMALILMRGIDLGAA